MFNDVFISRDTLAVFDKFIAGFYGSHKVNLQTCFIRYKTLGYRVVFYTWWLIKHSCSFIKQYLKISEYPKRLNIQRRFPNMQGNQ